MDLAGNRCVTSPEKRVKEEKEQQSLFRFDMQPQDVSLIVKTANLENQPESTNRLENWCDIRIDIDSTLEELRLYNVTIESNHRASEAIALFNANPLLPGIAIATEGEFVGMISRRRFFEYLSRPYSLELFAKRPLLILYGMAKTEILVLPSQTPIAIAAKAALQRSPGLIYEPIIVQNSEDSFQILDIHDLLLAQCQIHDRAAAALRQTEAKYRNIFENAVDGIYQTTPDGRFISANPALAKICGYSSPAQLIETCNDVSNQMYSDRQRRAEFIAALKEYDSISGFESLINRPDGSQIWITENARAVRDESGNLLYYEGIVEDITDKKQAAAKLKQQTQELKTALHQLQQTQSQLIQTEKISSLGQLVAGVAHEINNPINCVYSNIPHARQSTEDLLNLLQLYLKHYQKPPDEITAFAAEIDVEFLIEDLPKILVAMQQGSERILEIARSLRTFSRQDESQMKPADLHEGIDSTLLILHHRIKAKNNFPGVQVIKKYGNLPLVECYAGQINQVFMNLIGNAIDVFEEGIEKGEYSNFLPTIRITTERQDNWARIQIVDNGLGMTEEVQKRLFDPFFTTKSPRKGTGLGLSISHQIIVEKHGGKINCISTPGQGTEFIVEIPISRS
jgi:two-component system, NtrC family, sensor kinase